MMKEFTQKKEAYDEHGRRVEELVVVQDGTWVAFASARYWSEHEYGACEGGAEDHLRSEGSRFTIVAGAARERVKRIVLSSNRGSRYGVDFSSRWGSSFSMYLCDQPFGVISENTEDGRMVGGAYLHCARQVHKGELGRRPPFQRPQFAREAPSRMITSHVAAWRRERGLPPVKPRDQRRGKRGWTRLTDVAALIRMDPEGLVRRYFAFTDVREPALHVIFAHTREEIHCQRIVYGSWTTYNWYDLPELFEAGGLEDAWIRQGFANTVLLLHRFGHVPALPYAEALHVAV